MNTFLPVLVSLVILFGGVALERHFATPGGGRMPWPLSAGFILIAVIANRFVRSEWPLEGWWDLPRSVLVIGTLYGIAAWAWRRRQA